MYNQLMLFKQRSQGTQVENVWESLTQEEQKAATKVLAELMIRSVVSEYKEKNGTEVNEEKTQPIKEVQNQIKIINERREANGKERFDE